MKKDAVYHLSVYMVWDSKVKNCHQTVKSGKRKRHESEGSVVSSITGESQHFQQITGKRKYSENVVGLHGWVLNIGGWKLKTII